MKKIERKFIKTYNLYDYEILTDSGFEDIIKLHETIEYDVYELKLKNGISIQCADTHIVFDENYNEIFVKDLKPNDNIITKLGILSVESIHFLGYKENMYDFELADNTKHRYYTNDILSHNTETAKVISEEIFGPNSLIRIDMSEYSEKISASRMTGAAPGYVGYEEGSVFESVRRKPFSVVLFDEIEKAHPDIFNILLQILDEGRLTDNSGRVINFKNTIIIMTSNVGVKNANVMGKGVGFTTSMSIKEDQAIKENIMKSLKDKFAPEFLNRINEIVTFNQLTEGNIKDIVEIQLGKLGKRITDIGYTLSWSKYVVDYIAKETFDPLYGARPVERGIQKLVEDLISEEILRHEPKVGTTIKLKYNKIEDKISIDFKK